MGASASNFCSDMMVDKFSLVSLITDQSCQYNRYSQSGVVPFGQYSQSGSYGQTGQCGWYGRSGQLGLSFQHCKSAILP